MHGVHIDDFMGRVNFFVYLRLFREHARPGNLVFGYVSIINIF